MKYCSQCGAQMDDAAVFCPTCGYRFGEGQQQWAPPPVGNRSGFAQDEARDAADHKAHAILGYFGILILVPILSAKDSPFAKFHANQSLWLIIAGIALSVITSILGWIPGIGWLIALISWGAGIAIFVFEIMGIVYAAKGEKKFVPLVDKLPTILK